MSDFLRMSGIYWSITFLDLSNSIERLNQTEIVDFIKENQDESGGFSPSNGHEPHLLYTLSAIQTLITYDKLDVINKEQLIEFISKLQQPDGSFAGDNWGEIDTRFSFCAVAALHLLVI
jgi:geranylgeranyl transferase type-2 subunit beta